MVADLATQWAALQMELEAHRPDRARRRSGPTGPATPVCLLTGFLGAGKTTLLVDLLSNPPDGMRVKAIVNDVGSLPFDPTLVGSDLGVRVELTNGCACCERTADLADSLGELGADPDCDLIVLEASGVADPFGLEHLVAADPSLRLDRIVTVVNAAQIDERTRFEPVASIIERQMASAHSVVVSGCDLVPAHAVDAAVDHIARLAPGRPIERSARSAPASRALLPTSPRGARPGPADAGVHRSFHVVTVVQQRSPTLDELCHALVESRPGLVRAKGRLVVEGRSHLVQLTPQTIEIVETPGGTGSLTLIGIEPDDVRRVIDLIAPDTATDVVADRPVGQQ